jgi:hypothetical protein
MKWRGRAQITTCPGSLIFQSPSANNDVRNFDADHKPATVGLKQVIYFLNKLCLFTKTTSMSLLDCQARGLSLQKEPKQRNSR